MNGFTHSADHLTACVAISIEAKVCLTPMQKKVLALVSDNLRNKQIAFILGITEATVKVHVSAILKRLGVKNRKEARAYYQNDGAVRPCEIRAEA